ncbi:LAQU0S04e01948g1_1 [Lachancea quebecensis]|uniref:LAQU0S04e01948g1_1 n=1 Tax=Lachancea quebecensis TaxID=1654605 RepID=A0A0P1KPU4_9SACH|nr:LAQU0S04e01948g1_1 [Lachancea quebecensis]
MFTHSHAIRSGLSGRLRQSHDEHISFRYNAQYIISAEFDNKVGPVIKHQHPKPLAGFKSSTSRSSSVNLASLMIPNSAESRPDVADFTVFILYKDKYTRNYHVFPIADSKLPQNDARSPTILEEDEPQSGFAGEASTNHNADTKEPPLFFLSVVNTLHDKSNDRGATIKSIALGTTMQNFMIFKPLLAMTLDLYMRSNDDPRLLIDCFNMINSLDLSFAKRTLANASLQSLLNSISDENLIAEIFNPAKQNLQNILHLNTLPETDVFGNKISFKRHLVEYQFTKFRPTLLPPALSRISLQIDLINFDPVKVNINYNDHVLKFLLKFIPQLDELPRSRFSWRLFVNSTKLPKDTLCQFILSLSNFIKHFDFHYFENAQVIIFPYMDISFLDALREQLVLQNGRRMFTIVGVSNPIFEYQKDVWDFYYDMDAGSLQTRVSSMQSLASLQNISQEAAKSSKKMKNIFQKRASYAMPLAVPSKKCGLTWKMITYLVNERHDNETVLNVFKRINILQLLSLLKDIDNRSQADIETELSLKDDYAVSYRDFIIFPEFFEYGTLKLIRCFAQLEQDLNYILFDGKKSGGGNNYNVLESIFASLKQINKFMASSTANTDKFFNIGLNFPLTAIQRDESLTSKDFFDVDLEKYFSELKMRNSMEMLDSHHKGVVDYFAMKRFQRLLFLPLLIDPEIEYCSDYSSRFGLTDTTHEDSGSNVKRIQMSEISLSPMSSIFNDESLFRDGNFEDLKSRTLSSKSGSIGKDSLRDQSELMVPKIRSASVAIIHRTQKHAVGRLLLEYKLNPMFQSIFASLREETISKRKSDIEKRDSLRKIQVSAHEANMNVSPSRRNLLNDLNAISQHQDDIKSKLASEGKPARASILSTLNRLTSGFDEMEI